VFASIAGSAIGSAFGGGGGAAVSAGSTAAGYSADVLSKWPGLSDGGWTGPGGKYEPKGVVHGDEFVIRKEVVQQPGMRGYLERLNKKGYADGGYVGLSGGSSSAPTAPGGVVIQQSFVVQGAESGTSQKDSQALGQAYADIARRGAQAEIAKETQPGGQIWRLVNGR
jgi:lambda family phage tail tape measure protein